MRICVYGAASSTIDKEYVELVENLGEEMAKRGHNLVFGGGGTGLMGAVARGVHRGGGDILGVIPKFFKEENIECIFEFCNELILPDTMRERKQIMEDNADAFIMVPGGVGTFDEFFEILTLKQLKRHNKAMTVLNVRGYYDAFVNMMTNAVEEGFVAEKNLELFKVFDGADEMLDYIEGYEEADFSVEEVRNIKGDK